MTLTDCLAFTFGFLIVPSSRTFLIWLWRLVTRPDAREEGR